jgi:hypothetical protein
MRPVYQSSVLNQFDIFTVPRNEPKNAIIYYNLKEKQEIQKYCGSSRRNISHAHNSVPIPQH